MMEVADNWILIAFAAPFLWAVMIIVDVYFIDQVYTNEYDGIVISGLFHILPWLLVISGMLPFTGVPLSVALLALGGGMLFLVSLIFYFKALFREDDGALSHSLWNFDILIVPIFAWFLAGERLAPEQYGGIGIAFVGAMLLGVSASERFKKQAISISPFIFMAILFSSASMIFMKMAYDSASAFWSLYLLFCAGVIATSVALPFVAFKKPARVFARVFRLTRKYVVVFFVSELLGVIAIATSQRALSLSPSASFVNIIEGFTPIFIIAISAALAPILLKRNRSEKKIYQKQCICWVEKITAVFILSFGVYVAV